MVDNDQKITILRGPEKVRRRAAVIFGDDGIAGVEEMLRLLLEIFLKQCKTGFCKHLTLTRDREGVLTLEGDDVGLYLCDPAAPTDAIWQQLFCDLTAAPRDPEEFALMTRPDIFLPPAGEIHEGFSWYQLNLFGSQCASSFFEVRVRRDGWKYHLRFEKGENVGGLTRKKYDGATGTRFTFRPDPEVFRETELSAEFFPGLARVLSLSVPGLTVTVLDEKLDLQETFCYQGIGEYLQGELPVYTAQVYAQGRERYDRKEYKASVRMGLTFCADGDAACIHEHRWLSCGGTHLEALYKKLWKYLTWELGSRVTLKAVKQRTKLLLITEAEDTYWENGTRQSICNILLRDMTEDTLEENFRQYIRYHRDRLLELFL